MADILFLRGAPAFPFSGCKACSNAFRHWCRARLAWAPSSGISPSSNRPLAMKPGNSWRPCSKSGRRGARTANCFLVVPRVGTISPWSSKATDIAWNCGLSGIERIERGIAFRIEGVPAAQRESVAALLHDRMIEAVFGTSIRPPSCSVISHRNR